MNISFPSLPCPQSTKQASLLTFSLSAFRASHRSARSACLRLFAPALLLTLAPDLKAATFTGVETIDVTLAEPTKAIT